MIGARHLAELAEGEALASAAASAVTVLVVDDSPLKRQAIRAMLAPLDYSIVEADSGVAALRCVMAQDFAVILLDVRMPLMDGFETAGRIRARRQSELTPIIFVTAYEPDEIETADLYAEGAVDFISSPFPPAELRAKVTVFANLYIRAELLADRARVVKSSADQLRLLTDAAPIGMFQTDYEGAFVYTNPRWSEITGISLEEATGNTWDGLSQEHPGRITVLSEAVIDRDELSQQFEIRSPGAARRTVVVTSTLIPGETDAAAGWVGTLADITVESQARAAMAEARDRATETSQFKSDFLANMSHEIRTPMNGVIGMTDLLLETDLDDQQRDYAVTVRRSGDALLSIINDILDFSKIEAGKWELENLDFDVSTIVDDVIHLLAGSAQDKRLTYAAVVDDSLPTAVHGDPGRVRQVLTNLVGNAIKFTQAGEIAVRVTQEVTAEGETVVRFEISDTGDGIAADKLDTIFEPFVQVDTSTSRKYGGTGLGLAISSQLVALMGGKIGVSSELGKGSTFWFTTPVELGTARADDSLKPVRTSSATRGMTEMGRLLLAEDNLINQKVALAILSGAGYQVDTVLDGAAAVRAASTQSYDAILMDCQMPEMNGYQATAAIRANEGRDKHTPIIAFTAGARQEDRDRCLAERMDSYLAKPVSKDALLDLVAQTIERVRSAPITPNGKTAVASPRPRSKRRARDARN